jgi:hypothetical protein
MLIRPQALISIPDEAEWRVIRNRTFVCEQQDGPMSYPESKYVFM